MKKFFGFGSSTPPPPPPPAKPPSPPARPTAPAVQPSSSPAKDSAPALEQKPFQAPTAPSIVGCWKEPDGTDTTEFLADGSVIERPTGGDTIRGRYSIEGKQLKIKLDGMDDELCFPVAIADDSLEMTDPDGKITKYRRIL